jgi:thiol-disulfide isomerase/thioredoxin
VTRPPHDQIPAPPVPAGSAWIGTEPLVMGELRGRPVLLEFWDFCRPNSLRTLPYLQEWHRRYAAQGLVVVSVHSPGFRASADEDAVRAAVERLAISHPVVLDTNFALWQDYENAGWPGRYLWNQDGMLADYHYGEGAYEECERAIGELLGVAVVPMAPLRPEDAPGARLLAPSADRTSPPWDGRYEAGAAWAVLDPGRRHGSARANGRELTVEHPGAYLLVEHAHHSAGRLELELGPGVRCDGVCFTPGLAAD